MFESDVGETSFLNSLKVNFLNYFKFENKRYLLIYLIFFSLIKTYLKANEWGTGDLNQFLSTLDKIVILVYKLRMNISVNSMI